MVGRTRVLVVEDDYFLATELARVLETAGVQVVGPVATVRDALNLIDPLPDAATLDVHLGEETSLPIADALARCGVPFVFATASPSLIPAEHAGTPVLQKPCSDRAILNAIASCVASHPSRCGDAI